MYVVSVLTLQIEFYLYHHDKIVNEIVPEQNPFRIHFKEYSKKTHKYFASYHTNINI